MTISQRGQGAISQLERQHTEAPSPEQSRPSPGQDDFSAAGETPTGMPVARPYDHRRDDPNWGVPSFSYDTGQEDPHVVDEQQQ